MQLFIINISVICLYAIVMLIIDCIDDAGVANGIIRHGFGVTSVLYDLIYLLSTVITVIAIFSLYKTIVKLKQFEDSISVNNQAIAVHVGMLVLTSILALT